MQSPDEEGLFNFTLTESSNAPNLYAHTLATNADGLLKGPTADKCEKGGRPMANSPFPAFRKEVQDYLRSCEHLISAVISPNSPVLSKEELEMVEYPTPSTQAPPRSRVSCPYCSSAECYRSRRHGGQDFIHRLVGMFPWHCEDCGNRFYLVIRSLPSRTLPKT